MYSEYPQELTFSCYRGYPFLRSDLTCGWLASAINSSCEKLSYELIAYVFMPEHVHLIVQPRNDAESLGRFLQSVKEPVGRRAIKHIHDHAPSWLPRVTRQRGKRNERVFWQSGGGYRRSIDSESALNAMIEYIHLNPVRRGLSQEAVRWEWSSASWYFTGTEGPCRVHGIRSM